MEGLDKKGWKNALKQSFNLSLGTSNSTQGASSYDGSFDVDVSEKGFAFIPRVPAAYVIDKGLYDQIFKIANIICYPYYTVIKKPTMNLIPWDSVDFHNKRALWYDWMSVNHRVRVSERYISKNDSHKIPIMSHYFVNFDNVTSVLIAGNSGSGKSYFLSYLLNFLHGVTEASKISDLFVIDPKKDSPARWCKARGVECIFPTKQGATSDFVADVTEVLSRFVKIIYDRQDKLYLNPNIKFTHICVVIDELLALTENVPRKLKDAFFSIISTISLMGRSTNVHLILVSQRFDANVIPVVVRQQANLKVQLGVISNATTRFLFEDLDPAGILIPTGQGTGLISFNDNQRINQVLPLQTPTFEAPRGVI